MGLQPRAIFYSISPSQFLKWRRGEEVGNRRKMLGRVEKSGAPDGRYMYHLQLMEHTWAFPLVQRFPNINAGDFFKTIPATTCGEGWKNYLRNHSAAVLLLAQAPMVIYRSYERNSKVGGGACCCSFLFKSSPSTSGTEETTNVSIWSHRFFCFTEKGGGFIYSSFVFGCASTVVPPLRLSAD